MSNPGMVYLVGAGPGDPELLTLKALRLIREADVLVYDFLVRETILDEAKPGAEKIYVGKRAGSHTIPQGDIETLLLEHAKAGKTVVRLKGGDPLVFGRGGEEAEKLAAAGIGFEMVPGVTAACAAAATTGIPLTHREHASAVTFLTGHENPEKTEFQIDFRKAAEIAGTLCIYMGVGHLRRISEELIAGGRPATEPAALVQWATTPRQRTVVADLATLADEVEAAGLSSPAMVFVGPVARYAHALNWYEDRPLHGKRIAVTRTASQSGEISKRFEELGAEVLNLPLIKIEHISDFDTTDDVFSELWSYKWIVFTSANGVRGYFDVFDRAYDDIRSFGLIRIAAIGEATAKAVRARGLRVDVMPEKSTAEDLADAILAEEGLDSEKVLVVTGNLNRETLVARLEAAQAIVDVFPVYRTTPADLDDLPAAKRFREQGADAVVFASSSAVKSFAQQAEHLQLAPEATRPLLASMGPQTSEAIRKLGLTVGLEASEPSIDALVTAVTLKLG